MNDFIYSVNGFIHYYLSVQLSKDCCSDLYCEVEQLGAHWVHNPEVDSSSLSLAPTNTPDVIKLRGIGVEFGI